MNVLLIEDETVLRDMIAMYLTEEGHSVQRVISGMEGIQAIRKSDPDIAIIDCLLPDINGIELCKEIRQFSFLPIIMISMNTDVSNRIEALLNGVNDYLCKPFSMKELSARMIAQLRAAQEGASHYQNRQSETVDDFISVDRYFRTIRMNGHVIETTFTEFEIMQLFNRYPGRVFSREEIITYLRGSHTLVSERSIDVHVTKLRNKIEKDPKNPKFIKTVWGIGYKYSNK
ncbi:response regulator transcription factor [Paenibacillus montanisoli]|uniref:DNA-binding response regulator n=1 Tax=Paenibacillus montanisoli TaxID=2081970 RepID=A0A328U5H2_9BACL|nr:response regulator transcription factor [Paenibacillus montanisoli]RAP77322.1 DNA-binding response regulator [Paenibacillus montanisoli]